MSLNPGRIVGIVVGAVAILGIGVYGPAMLLGPLPAVTVDVDETAVAASTAAPTAPISLPETGSSALALVADDGSAETLALGGDPAAVPIGGAAKLVTVLATLDSLPLPAEGDGPGIKIGPDDYTDYLRYSGEGSRTLQVSPGETWSERDVVRAILLASSNNHADTLVRWAFGGVGQYVEAANAWLAEQGFTTIRVDDATGLSGDNVGSADELTRLVALVLADPELAEMYGIEAAPAPGTPATPAAPTAPTARSVPDVVDRDIAPGIRAIARSYTDEAGLSFLYTTTVPAGDGEAPHRVIGAMLLMPDYETLDPAVVATVDSVAVASQPIAVITAGTRYGSVETAWGEHAELVASVDRADASWGKPSGEASITVKPFTTATAGHDVGRVSVASAGGELASPLTLSDDIRDPGPLWRLMNPIPLVTAFFASQDG
jgi:D-alanyl-D-alanine carboxypeptidase (penicillin-binding protein 5/6)